jgi:hypothetical protein
MLEGEALAEHGAKSGTSSPREEAEAGERGGVELGGDGTRSRSGSETRADAWRRRRLSSERNQGAWGAKRGAPAVGEVGAVVGGGEGDAGGAGGVGVGSVALPGGDIAVQLTRLVNIQLSFSQHSIIFFQHSLKLTNIVFTGFRTTLLFRQV